MEAHKIIGRQVLHYDQVGSTNDLVREFAERGEVEGLVVTAEEQTAGRGRHGRKWTAPRGSSLQFSVLMRPPIQATEAHRITRMAALAVVQTLEHELGIAPTLKWPNDVLLNGRKCTGILTETSIRSSRIEFAVLGIGLNVNFSMREYPELVPYATTLRDEIGHDIDREPLLTELLGELDNRYDSLIRGQDFMQEYRKLLPMLGKRIRLKTGDDIVEGTAVDVDSDGGLVILQAQSRQKFYAGDATVLRGPDTNQEERQ